jgi:hypothetical protein
MVNRTDRTCFTWNAARGRGDEEPAERRRINRQQTRVSRRIHREKYDAQH